MLPMKNNLARDSGGFAYRVEEAAILAQDGVEIITSRVHFDDHPVYQTADEIVEYSAI